MYFITHQIYLYINLYYSFTLLCRIILVWLAVPFPYVAIDVIEIIGRNIWNAVELKKIGISRNSQEWEQDYDWKHRCRQKYRSGKDCNIELLDVTVESIYIYTGVSLTAGRTRNETRTETRRHSLHCNSGMSGW